MTWHALTLDHDRSVIADHEFNSLGAAERFIHQDAFREGNNMTYQTYHEASHHRNCECLDCTYDVGFTLPGPPRWQGLFEAFVAVVVFFLIGFIVGVML